MRKTKVKTNSKGITLIALVVTIVVLLILAGISINLVLGNNGIIAKAQDAEVGTRAGRLEDEIELWKADAYIADNANGTTETEEEMLARLVRDKLITQDDEVDERNKIIRVRKKDKQTVVKEISYAYKTSTITENIFEYTPEGIITGIKEKYLIEGLPRTATDEKRTIKMASINNEPIKLALMPAPKIYLVEKLNGEITIPKEIEGTKIVGIGDGAFYRIRNLKKVTINADITSIGNGAFSGCENLTNITIPNSVTNIGEGAFDGTDLTNITIPSSVTSIGGGIFYGCNNLSSIIVEKNNPTYDSRDNCNAIIEKNSNKLIAGCYKTIIPNSVTSIGNRAFSGCDSLTNITIPESVRIIEEDAFSGCSFLKVVVIPNSVTSIGHDAFWYCSGLKIILANDHKIDNISDAPWGAENAEIINMEEAKNREEEFKQIVEEAKQEIEIIKQEEEEERILEAFKQEYLKNKSRSELEELILKTMRYIGTFENYLKETSMTREDIENMAKEKNMTYEEFLKMTLLEYPDSWLQVEYYVKKGGGEGKSVQELEKEVEHMIFEETGENITFEELIEREFGNREGFENALKEMRFRTEEDYLKVVIYCPRPQAE